MPASRPLAFPNGYEYEIANYGGYSVTFRNRATHLQLSGDTSCGTYAILSLSGYSETPEMIVSPNSRLTFARTRTHWMSLIGRGQLPPMENLDNVGVSKYMRSSGLPGLQDALIWCPTLAELGPVDSVLAAEVDPDLNLSITRNGPNSISLDLREMLLIQSSRLRVILNTGGHWIAVVLLNERDRRRVTLEYMESMDNCNESSVRCLFLFLLPALRGAIDAVQQVFYDELGEERAIDVANGPPQARLEDARTRIDIIAEQDRDADESARIDAERYRDSAVRPQSRPQPSGTIGIAEAFEGMPQPSREEMRRLVLERFTNQLRNEASRPQGNSIETGSERLPITPQHISEGEQSQPTPETHSEPTITQTEQIAPETQLLTAPPSTEVLNSISMIEYTLTSLTCCRSRLISVRRRISSGRLHTWTEQCQLLKDVERGREDCKETLQRYPLKLLMEIAQMYSRQTRKSGDEWTCY